MNGEQVNSEQEPYNLITITWADLQRCTDAVNIGNLIIKPVANDGVQFIQATYPEVKVDNVCLQFDKTNAPNNNNDVTTNELSTFLTLPPTSTASIDLPPITDENEQKSKSKTKKNSKRKPQPETPIKCPLCEKVLMRLTQYRQHMQEHRNMKKYKCEHCSESYNIEKNFKVHMAMHAKGDPVCPICDRKFQRLASLKSHLILHQVEETFACNECLAEFEKEEDLNIHMEVHIKEQQEQAVNQLPLVCTYCSYMFQDSDQYKEHVTLHIKAKRAVSTNKRFKKRNVNTNRDYPHKCDHCPKSFPKLCLLERHRRIHTGERPFVCPICNRAFSQKGTLQIHLNKHDGKKPFECVFCGSKFTQKGNLRVHLEKTHSAHSPGEKVYRCIHCTCIFKKVASLNAHIAKVHLSKFTDDNVNIIALIDQLKELDKEAIKPQPKLNTIEPIKEVEIPQVVDEMGKGNELVNDAFLKVADSSVDGFVRRYIVKQRQCGDTRWFICSYCSKEFKKPSDLIRHIRKHTQEKPFKCKECGQTFALKSTLRNHLNTHTRASCECVICLKKFSSIRTLNVHLRKHDKTAVAHKTRCYKCSVCDKTFVSLENAMEHMLVHEVPDTVILNKETPKIDINLVMKQPMIETENGLLSVAAPRPKFPYASLEQYKNRPFKCHICNAAFFKNVHLKRHMLTHTGTKDFICEYCFKCFVTKYALKEHKNYHTQTKNYECKHCKKKFYTNSILKRHLLMHSSQKPYICPYCKKRFKQAQFCRKHIRKTHKRDLNESLLAMSESGELNLEATKIMDLTDILNDPPFQNLDNEGNATLTPIETYNDISTLENKVINSRNGGRNIIQKKTIVDNVPVQETSMEVRVLENDSKKVDTSIKTDTKSNYPLDINEVTIENLQENSINYPTIYISTEDLQLLSNSSVVNSLLPQLKLQNTDPLLLSSINELQDSNILYPLDASITPEEPEYQTDTQTYESFNPNMIFNPAINDINLTISNNKDLKKSNELTTEQIDLELNEIASQKVDSGVLNDNLIIFNGDAQKNGDLNYFNINFNQNDYIDLNTLNLPANTSIGKVMQPNILEGATNLMCSNCTVHFKSLEEFDNHVCEKIGDNPKDSCAEVDAVEIPDKDASEEKDESPTNAEMSEKEETENFSCRYCDNTFSVHTALMRHISFKHKETVDNSCNICKKQFKKRSDLVRHLRTHTGEKPYSCDKCDKSFSLKSTLMSHYRTHNPSVTKDFKCQVCDTYVSCKSSLKAHMVLHTDIRRFSCTICTLKFKTSQQRRSHMATHKADKKKNTSSKKNNINLLESMLLETNNEIQNLNNEEIEPEISNTDFQETTENLITSELPIVENLVLSDVHLDPILLQLPTNNYPMGLQLEIDGQLINMKPNLEGSIESFSQEEVSIEAPKEAKAKKVQCDICLKIYVSKSVLSKHKRLLHGQYKCDKCSKAFNSIELLEKHTRLHFGYRPYSCSLCANSFTEESSLKVHLRRIHKSVDPVSTIETL